MYRYRITADNGIFYYTAADTARHARRQFRSKMFSPGFLIPEIVKVERLAPV